MERLTERTKLGSLIQKSTASTRNVIDKLGYYEESEEQLVIHTGMNFKSWLKHTTTIFEKNNHHVD